MATQLSETADILHNLIADDNYHAMYNRFTREGMTTRCHCTGPD